MLIGIYHMDREEYNTDFTSALWKMKKLVERDSIIALYVVKGRRGPLHINTKREMAVSANDIKLHFPEGDYLKDLNNGRLNREMLKVFGEIPADEEFWLVPLQNTRTQKKLGIPNKMKVTFGEDPDDA